MKKKAGVWIDTEKAVIISLDETTHHIHTVEPKPGKRLPKMPKSPHMFHSIISSMIEKKMRIPGDTKEFSKAGSQHFSTELKNEHKLSNEKAHYFREIMQEIKDMDEIVLFGPSITKRELETEMIKNPHLKSHLMAVESADTMTDNQMEKWVEEYFITHDTSHKH